MRFDLTDLRLFLNVLEAGTITGGAEATHMTLASASERVRAMEDTLGAALLLRERRGVRPTAAGHTLAQHARLVLHQVERLQGELGGYGRGLQGHIRLLCNTSALSEHLPQALSGFLAEHPLISVELEERVSYEIVDAVRNDLCDIGVVSDAADLAGLQSFVFRADPLALIVPRGHALAQRAGASLADVVDQPFVGLSEGSALQEHVEHHARRQGRRLAYRVRLRSLEAICRMVGAGIGVGIVPQAVAVRCARAAGIKRIALSDAWAARSLMLCVRELEALPVPTRQLVRHLLQGAPAQ
ncbi:LysR family transcriptional regulator [Cupriavidus sp. USMAA2-4]|uniref:LysR family transcriptional regulator n=1 Tax=Cupriavidus sp. USMAA2-4 TaxID=876364 RepID=UPI0008A6DC02|nr:LysR family transcriptional regulator [Cupriavidus sp. USMAA2-4]AOY96297.1 LysR family transcriptional regulator [Cupriavidus sp. USMAA2-4]